MFDLILQIDIQRVFRSGLLHPQPRVSIYWNYRSSGFDKFNLFYIYWEIYHKLPYLVSSLIQYEYLRYYPCFGNMIWCVPLHTIMRSTGHTSRFHWLDLITAPFFSVQWLCCSLSFHLFFLPHFVYFFETCTTLFLWLLLYAKYVCNNGSNIWEQILCLQGSPDGPEQYVLYDSLNSFLWFCIDFHTERFSSFQICCNHECNILCPTLYGT